MVDVLIAEIPKNALERIRVSRREFKGHEFIDIRIYFMSDDDQWLPSKKGVTVAVDAWDEFMEALGRVQAHLDSTDTGALA